MKNIMIIMLLTISYPVFPSINCLEKSKHLKEDFDDKEWHSAQCDCPCQLVRKNICTECGHLQNAATYTVVMPTKIAQQSSPHFYDPQKILEKLALTYLRNKK